MIRRHINAALLGAFLRVQPDGLNIRSSIGPFIGATLPNETTASEESIADKFVKELGSGMQSIPSINDDLSKLVRGTVLQGRDTEDLLSACLTSFEGLVRRWRAEYDELLARRQAAAEPEVQGAFERRARRMHGEFLLGELTRRGFTPAYGFPVDVVSFDNLAEGNGNGGNRRATSRTLDVAIREYGPGAEIVVNGLVHRSEGILPAWSAMADASKLEDLQFFWECRSCRAVGTARTRVEECPSCAQVAPHCLRTLRPSGFIGRQAPHGGYEQLGHIAYEMPKITAAGSPWQSLPDPAAGRVRAAPGGQVFTMGSGAEKGGYALCLVCGRAHDDTADPSGDMPGAIRQHRPLAAVNHEHLVRGYCPGGLTNPERIQRHVRFLHTARTDIFELQLPSGATPSAALALAAALREALTERLGAEIREVGLAVDSSTGPSGEARVSAFLFDRAAGGAGLSIRLSEGDWLSHCLRRAEGILLCPDDCKNGCPSCILRPDLSFVEPAPDRTAGLDLIKTVGASLNLPEHLRVFGGSTRLAGLSAND